MHRLTNVSTTDVYFKLKARNGTWFHAMYTGFRVGPESDNYRLQFNPLSYTGNAGRSLMQSNAQYNAMIYIFIIIKLIIIPLKDVYFKKGKIKNKDHI